MSRVVRVCCVMSGLALGGAERNMVKVAGWLRDAGMDVTLLTLDPDLPDFFASPPGVPRVRAHPAAFASCRWYDLRGHWRRRRALRAAILALRPDVVLAFTDKTNIAVCRALRADRLPVVVSERVHPDNPLMNLRWRGMRRLSYPRAQSVVMISEDSLAWARRQWPRWRAILIPNAITPPAGAAAGIKQPVILALGRLVPQKGFDLLIAAFARVAEEFPQWRLCIFGDGPERGRLEALIAARRLTGRVSLPGPVADVAGVLQAGEIFVLSSRFEGFPNALAEAMACGLPSIAFDCPGAARELIRHDRDGLLVPREDASALAEALARLMRDGAARARMGEGARQVVARYPEARIAGQWVQLVQAVAPA